MVKDLDLLSNFINICNFLSDIALLKSDQLGCISKFYSNADPSSIAPAVNDSAVNTRDITGTANFLSNRTPVVIDAAFGNVCRLSCCSIAYCHQSMKAL